MDPDKLKKIALKAIEREKESIVGLSRYINSNPETAFREFLASKAITGFLSGHGFNIQTGTGGLETAFVADYGNELPPGEETVPVALIAEYDALPDVGHGCGHNLIAAAASAAAVGVAAALEAGGPGRAVRVIGAPAEEVLTEFGGKALLINEGVFNRVGSALIFHPWTETGVALKDLGNISFHIGFSGRPAHAAADPWNGINAVDAAVILYNSISMLRQQLPGGMKLHCVIPEAGRVLNIIPERAAVEVMLRSTELEDLKVYEERIRDCAEAAAKASGCSCDFEMMATEKPVRFNQRLFDFAAANMKSFGEELPAMPLWEASSDFGDVSHEVPSLSLLYKTHDEIQCWHSREVAEQAAGEPANAAMLRAAGILAATAIDIIFET